MRRAGFALLACLCLIIVWLAASPAVSIHVSPQVLMVNGSLQITCRVLPDPRNRQLTAGLRFYTASSRELAGERAPVTWTFPPTARLLCPETDDTYTAFCQILRSDDSVATATQTIVVSGCN